MSPSLLRLDRAAPAAAALACVFAVLAADRGPVRPAYSENPVTGEFRTTEAISRMEHHVPPSGGSLESWYFCFDHTGGGWTCVPVSEGDFRRYGIGQHVALRQRPGQLAELRPGAAGNGGAW